MPLTREEGKFAQTFEIVYHHPIVKEKFWKSFFAGLMGAQYKYKSEEPLTLNNLVSPKDTVTSGWDTNIYNWAEFFFAFVVRVPKNLFKFVTEFIWVGLYLNLEPGSYRSYVPLVFARIGQTFTSPITAVSQTAEGTLERLKHRSWISEIPGILGTLLHVLLATCIATAYLILTATILFSLLHSVGLGSVVVAGINFANYLGSISFLGQLGSLFISLVAKVGAMVGLNFVTSGLLPVMSLACSLLTMIVPLAVVRWLLRQSLDISPVIEKLKKFFGKKDVSAVKVGDGAKTKIKTPLPPLALLPESKHASTSSSSLASDSSQPLVEHLQEHEEQIEDGTEEFFTIESFTIIPEVKVTPGNPITIDPGKPMEVKLFIRPRKGNVQPYNQSNVDPNIILSIDGKNFSLRRNLRSTIVSGRDEKVTHGSSSTLGIGSQLAASGQPNETALFSCQTIPVSDTAPLVTIGDNNPINVKFLSKSIFDTTDSSAQKAVLSFGQGCSLELNASFNEISTVLSSLNKVSQRSVKASDHAGPATSPASGSNIIIGHGEVRPFNISHTDRALVVQPTVPGRFSLAPGAEEVGKLKKNKEYEVNAGSQSQAQGTSLASPGQADSNRESNKGPASATERRLSL